jgi:hypothetical protein
MREIENPVALAGADRAGIRHAEQQFLTRDSLKRQAQQRLRRQHLARRVHRLGPRVLFEVLDEIARDHGIAEDVDRRLAAYVDRLTPEMLRATGGDRFPPSPTRLLRGAA